MSRIVMTIHTFNHTYAGFSAPDNQSPFCKRSFFPAHRAGKLLINGMGNRQLQSLDVMRYRDLWQQASEICGGEEPTVVDLYGH